MTRLSERVLYLASNSQARKQLLTDACIPFDVIAHRTTEEFDDTMGLEEIVSMLAVRKLAHVVLPTLTSQSEIFILTADTLVQDKFGTIQNKPKDLQDAKAKIKAVSGKSQISTAFCLERREFNGHVWIAKEQIVQAVTADCYFEIPDSWIESYLEHVDVLSIAGAVAIEQYGAQFLKEIHGSYTAILGLPLFELREALTALAFFKR